MMRDDQQMGSAARVLIVGAGALGVTLGYHLSLGGARITFYVRPSRAPDFPQSRQLYCYEDASTRNFSGYDVVSSADEVRKAQFDFVVVTLDGAATRSVEGEALLRDLADATRDSDAVMILCGVGLGLHEHALRVTGLDKSRVLLGTLAYMSHETSVKVPADPAVDRTAMELADYAYGHGADRIGFQIARSSKRPALRFAALVEQAGIERCALVSPRFYAVFTAVFFAFTVVSELCGWPDAKDFEAHTEELSLAVAAMKEIATTPRFGAMGRRMANALSVEVVAGTHRAMEDGLRPLHLTTFNRHHHGGKVLAQNVGMLRDCRAAAAAAGHPTPALDELLARYDAHVAGKAETPARQIA